MLQNEILGERIVNNIGEALGSIEVNEPPSIGGDNPYRV